MRSLLLFISRFRVFILFIILELTAIGTYIGSHDQSRASTTASLNRISYTVYDWQHQMLQYFKLGTENKILREENALLKSALFAGQGTNAFHPNGSYEVIPCEIVMATTHRQRNYFTLNQGSLAGIEVEMGVIGNVGILGKVVSVSKHYALCKSILHKEIQISVSLEDSLYFGSMSWPGKNPSQMMLEDIPTYARIDTGQSVFTNSFSTIFPEGIEIAKVSKIETRPESNYYQIQLELVSDMNRSGTAYVVKNNYKEERLELEDQIVGDE